MAKITLNVPDEKVPRILAAFKSTYSQRDGEGNADFIRRILIKLVKTVVINAEVGQASKDAATAKRTEVISDLNGVS